MTAAECNCNWRARPGNLHKPGCPEGERRQADGAMRELERETEKRENLEARLDAQRILVRKAIKAVDGYEVEGKPAFTRRAIAGAARLTSKSLYEIVEPR